jgi:hypothetical protein
MRTREQDRVYRAELRARKRAEAETDATILDMPARPGDVEAAVRLELAGLAAAAERPGLAAATLRLAAILDDPGALVHHASAARVLGDILTRLHASKTNGDREKLLAMREARRDE